MLLGNRQLIVLKRQNVGFDRLADILDGLFPALTLRNASRETRALGDPKTVLARINNYLSHIPKATRHRWPVKRQSGDSVAQGTGFLTRAGSSSPARQDPGGEPASEAAVALKNFTQSATSGIEFSQ